MFESMDMKTKGIILYWNQRNALFTMPSSFNTGREIGKTREGGWFPSKFYVEERRDGGAKIPPPIFLIFFCQYQCCSVTFLQTDRTLLLATQVLMFTSRLNICNIVSLEIRRLHTDLITLYKIVHGFINCNNISFNFSSISNPGNRTRDNSYELVKNRIRFDIRKFFFCNRVFDICNCLSNNIVNCTTVKMFTCKLRKYDLSKFIRGRTLVLQLYCVLFVLVYACICDMLLLLCK